ncbi:hypothetical protein OGAPHI_002294 [Ogataea philodendri]|uniref:Protein kinase domain-containing protein n=1 Tax=Ogataea philodendri TaxID=1378263 RepID=A0A9P8T7U5_9ASCO|nr:uncharacterized protein OGAPHI_002294 [Ogataea philodendri]KAH3668540.1 hypothetical protein OGAPHI_002294 [Ogataea philodendri]
MNFLAKTINSTIGTLTGSLIPYNIGTRIVPDIFSEPTKSKSIWNIYDGTSQRDTSQEVSIFEFNLKCPGASKYSPLAKNCFRKLRSLSLLPGVLNILDTIETDSVLYIITERIKPLEDILKHHYSDSSIPGEFLVLGIFQLTEALKFLNVEGSSIHRALSMHSIFVNASGEWKLGCFELTLSIKDNDVDTFELAENLPYYNSSIYPPEVIKAGAAYFRNINTLKASKIDSYGLGIVINSLLSEASSGSNLDKLKMSLELRSIAPHVKKLLHQSPSIRYSVEQFLKAGCNSFFNISLVKVYKEITELNLKSDAQKYEIFQSLDELEHLPTGFFEYRVLPQLVSAFQVLANNDGNQQSALLILILKRAGKLDSGVFATQIKPLVLKAFSLPDRAIRMTLLNSLPSIVQNLSQQDVQDKIFPNLLQGFNDTNSSIREATIKSIIPIVSKISDRQLNNDLLRILAKLQSDVTPEIRTDTIVCLEKIAPLINSTSKTAVLVTAYSKALKDPFVPSRLNSVMAFESSIEYFSPEVCCSKILSAIAPALLDKSSKVRSEARRVFDLYMVKINDAATKLPTDNQETIDKESQESADLLSRLNTLSLSNIGFKNTQSFFGLNTQSQNSSNTNLDISSDCPLPEPSQVGYEDSVSPANEEKELNIDTDNWDSIDSLGPTSNLKQKVRVVGVNGGRPSSGSKFTDKGRTPSLKTGLPKPTKSLKLQSKSKLQLDLDVDEEGWGDGW